VQSEILFVTALGWEAQQVLRQLSRPAATRDGRATLWRSKCNLPSISVLQTGIGPALAARAIRWAGPIVRPSLVIVTGCAGALAEGLGTGDVVVADEIVGEGGAAWPTSGAWSDRYVRAAAGASLASRRGRLHTSAAILRSPGDKRSVAARSGAIAVDMETAAIAEWAAAERVELAAARVVVDDVRAVVPPELATITGPGGEPDLRRLILAIGKRPALVRELGSLGFATIRCRRALGSLHRVLIAELPLVAPT
jgi:adenosylhomocysteine nucleosidase